MRLSYAAKRIKCVMRSVLISLLMFNFVGTDDGCLICRTSAYVAENSYGVYLVKAMVISS